MRAYRPASWIVVLAMMLAASAQAQQASPDVMARFEINDAGYLADVGKYLEAVEALTTAFNVADAADIKAEALASKATLLAAFLDSRPAAIAQYDNILQNYRGTPSYAPALFASAMLRNDGGDVPNSRSLFQRYLQEFPSGPQAGTARFMLDQITPGTQPSRPAQPPPPITGRTIRIALKAVSSVALSSTSMLTADGEAAGLSATFGIAKLNGKLIKIESQAPIKVDSRIYRGKILLIPEGDQIRVVNDVLVEEYLYSVVASEVSASWPADALKAQAVASRTYAYYNVTHPRNPRFDVFDDTRSQEYRGFTQESPRTREAVDATRGQVLTYEGRVILAYFTSNSGGTTADSECVFDVSLPYLKTVKDDASVSQPNGTWTRPFPLAAVEEALRKEGHAVSGIQRIVPVKTCSGRMVELRIEHSGKPIVLNTRRQFRTAINANIKPVRSPENLPEILMSVVIKETDKGPQLEMSGGGWGHGVGLSQYGARGMATNGASYKQILSTYYPGTTLNTLN